MFILLCSDLAIRSGTALQIAPIHYDAQRRELNFKTKYSESVTVPVTEELANLMAMHCGPSDLPYVAALHPKGSISGRRVRDEFTQLRRRAGIKKRLTPHDLRRTTAVAAYQVTRDLRVVQAILGHSDLNSTLWYLDHHTAEIDRSVLELAKQQHGSTGSAPQILNSPTETIQ